MANIGVIGLGAMGLPIATNLLTADHTLYISKHRNPSPLKQLQEKGAHLCVNFAEVVKQSEYLILVLPDAPDVEELLFGSSDIQNALHENLMIIDMSTIALKESQKFAKRLEAKRVRYLDAPISGGPAGARNATLSVMVGSSQEDFERALPIFQSVGKSIIHCGEQGMGLAAKMANNLIVASELAAISEATVLAVQAGIAPDKLFEVLRGATAASRILDAKTPFYLSGEYNPGFTLTLMCKDLEIITGSAKNLGTPMPVGTMVQEMFRLAKRDFGNLDSSAVSLFYQALAKVNVAPEK
jgi:2-hydroxy-3-oxopropionate reductase